MKNIIILLLLIPIYCGAQNLVQAEYFFDTDPGYGNGNKLNFNPKETLTLDANLFLDNLDPGFRILYYRMKDDINGWGNTHHAEIFISSLETDVQEAEYFFDTDPGYGKGIKMQFDDQKKIILSANLYIELIPPGLHTFFFRFKNGTGWEHTLSSKVYKTATSKISKIIYWFDELQKEKSIAINPSVYNLSHSQTIDIEPLEDGLHKIHFQVENEKGTRSKTWTAEVLMGPNAGLEKMSDTEPAFYPNPATDFIRFKHKKTANQIQIVTMEGKVLRSIDSAEKIDVSDLKTGIYLLSYRMMKQFYISPLIIE